MEATAGLFVMCKSFFDFKTKINRWEQITCNVSDTEWEKDRERRSQKTCLRATSPDMKPDMEMQVE